RDTTVTYTLVIGNSGPGAQNDNPGDELTDVLPAGVTLVSANATSGTALATVATNTVTWNGTIPSAGSVTITIQATVDAANPTQAPLDAPSATGATTPNQGTIACDADGNGTTEPTVATADPGPAGANNPTSFQVAPSPGFYFTLAPCRVVDTRNATGVFGGPALVAGADRTFPLFG